MVFMSAPLSIEKFADAQPERPMHDLLARVSTGLGKPAYLPYGDPIRVLGTVAVVMGHVCDMVSFEMNTTAQHWWGSNLVNAACRWAVPVYIMLSGSLLLDPARQEDAGTFYKKRLSRLGIPILFWSLFFILFSIYYTGWNTPRQAVHDLIMGKPYPHLHFIFRIAGLYALTPMFRIFLAHASQTLVLHTTLLLLAMAALNTLFEAYTCSELSAVLRFAPFVGYYFAGYLLRDIKLDTKRLWACVLLFTACALTLTGGTALLIRVYGYMPFPSPSMVLFDFTSPVRICMALCAWLLLTNWFARDYSQSLWYKYFKLLAPATLGIYLIHPLFREILHLNGFRADSFGLWVGIPLVTLLVYLPSLLTALLLMRLKMLRKLVF